MNPSESSGQDGHWLDHFLETQPLPLTAPHPCSYLEGRLSRSQGFRAEKMPASVYRDLLDRNFRRSGQVFYRAACDGCQACRQLRVPVEAFVRSRSFERVWRNNLDLQVSAGAPNPSSEKYDLFCRYLAARHPHKMSSEWNDFVEFLYTTPTETIEFSYTLGDRLLAVSIADVQADGLSSVYVFYDPQYAKRSLGTYSVLWEIEHCRCEGKQYYYLGYHVPGARTMEYKARFQPYEVLHDQRRWMPGTTAR